MSDWVDVKVLQTDKGSDDGWTDVAPVSSKEEPKEPSLLDALKSGYEESATSLATKGWFGGKYTKPTVAPNTFMGKAAQMTGTVLGDLPAYLAFGAPAGIVGTPVAAPAAAMGGTELFKAHMRSLLGSGETPEQVGMAGLKGTAIGGVMGPLGQIAKVPGISNWAAKTAVPLEIAGGATVGAGMEGQLPTAEDIALFALPVAGLKVTGALTSKAKAAIEAKPKQEIFETRQKVADAAGIPQTAMSGAVKPSGEGVATKAARISVASERRRKAIEKEKIKNEPPTLEEHIETIKKEQEDYNKLLMKNAEEKTDEVIVPQEEVVTAPKEAIKTTPTEKVDVAQKGLEEPAFVKNFNEALKPEEIAKLKASGDWSDADIAELVKESPDTQRVRYNNHQGIVPEVKATPEEMSRGQQAYEKVKAFGTKQKEKRLNDINTLRENGYDDSRISDMSDDIIRRTAKKLNDEPEVVVNKDNVVKVEDIAKQANDLKDFDYKNASSEEFEAAMSKLEKLTNEADELGMDEIKIDFDKEMKRIEEDHKAEQKAILQGILDKKSGRTPKALTEPVEEHIPNEDLSPITEVGRSRRTRSSTGDEWEDRLASEGMPSELNFDEKLGVPKLPDLFKREKAEVRKTWNTISNTIDSIEKRRTVIRGNKEARNMIVDTYKFLPETKAEALEWLRKVEILENHVAPLLDHRQMAFSRKSIAKALDNKKISKEEFHMMNKILSTLKQQPTFGFDYDPKLGINTDGLYAFASNMLKIKDPKALAHEVGHFAEYNVLTSADRVEYAKSFTENYYDATGKLLTDKMKLETTDPLNATKNISELFAAKFADYTYDKVLTPTELRLYTKVKEWFHNLKNTLQGKGGNTKYDDVEHLFEKVLDPEKRRTWSEDGGEPIIEDALGRDSVNYAKGDFLGLGSIKDRAVYLASEWKKAHVRTKADDVLAEIKGETTEGDMKSTYLREVGKAETISGIIKEEVLDKYFGSPLNAFKNTILNKHIVNTNLAENKISFKYDKHKAEIDLIRKSLTDEQQVKVTKYLRDEMNGGKETFGGKVELTAQEYEAALATRSWLDKMKASFKEFLRSDFKKNLNKTEHSALLDLISGADIAVVKQKYPKANHKVIEEIFEDYKKIDSWGIDDYIPNAELGRYKMYINKPLEDGKTYKKLIAVGLSKSDAVRKATLWLQSEEGKAHIGDIFVDTDFKTILDDKSPITMRQYGAMVGKLAKEMQGRIKDIENGVGVELTKAEARDMAAKTLRRKFKITPTDVHSPFLEKKYDLIQGEENIFKKGGTLYSYAHSLEKKMQLDPVIEDIKKDLKNMNAQERELALDYIEDVKGRYGLGDRIVDKIMLKMGNVRWLRPIPGYEETIMKIAPYRGWSRAVTTARQGEAILKLGYRPVAAAINLLSGQGHTWVKVGAKTYVEAAKFLGTPKGHAFIKTVEPFLGISVLDIGDTVHAKTPILHPLGMFQKPEAINRKMSTAAAYLDAKKRGLSEEAAQLDAIRSNWAWQFTYNTANLPKIMRNPTGKLMTQFKPYLIKELEFMANLTGKEWLRYSGMQLALAGPRGALMVLKSLPFLAMMPWWEDAMDEALEWTNKNAPLISRGLGGLPGLIKPSLAVDVSGPATMQFPSGAMDIAGPFFSDVYKMLKEVVGPMFTYGAWSSDLVKIGELAPVWKYWHRMWDTYTSPTNKATGNYWIKDEKGNNLYEVKDHLPYILQSIAGTENVSISRIRNEQSILSREDARVSGMSTRIIDKAMRDFQAQGYVSNDTMELVERHGVSVEAMIHRIVMSDLPPQEKATLEADVKERFKTFERFPAEEDYSHPEQVQE